MSFHTDLRAALVKQLGKENVTFYPGWDTKQRGFTWTEGGKPTALMVHHTAGAATTSTDPKNKGNSKAADQPQATFVQNQYQVPSANFTVGRSGHVWVHAVYPAWHSGVGSFKGKPPYDTLGCKDNAAADTVMGVECVSKGLKQDFTSAEKWALGRLANACRDASGWAGFTKRLPNHKTWTTRKIDTQYSLSTLISWAENAQKKPL